jgi:hypothetical protein
MHPRERTDPPTCRGAGGRDTAHRGAQRTLIPEPPIPIPGSPTLERTRSMRSPEIGVHEGARPLVA